ncbi:MAG: hypothetical protein AAF483_00080 [Planctomycetota bacterium]
MGIYDRDYMRDEDSRSGGPSGLGFKLFLVFLIGVLLFVGMRLPMPPLIKIVFIVGGFVLAFRLFRDS